ncbi:longitudinals lacking protein-like [Colletes latitarsis]|uniref:longitudinals lacking protein-like n=1 Tax=Colletes latitarsis TaxID=2605962 RepID=UPI004035BDC6
MMEKKARYIGEHRQFDGKSYASKDAGESTETSSMGRRYGTHFYGDVLQAEHVCTACGKRYKWLDSLKRHTRVDCGNKEKKFSCHMCDRKFKYRYEMRNHIVAHHGA